MKEVIERCNWLVNKCNDKAITPDVKDDVRHLLEEIERLKENNENMQIEMARCWEKIDKAIEYINNICRTIFCDIEYDNAMELLEILKGDSNE